MAGRGEGSVRPGRVATALADSVLWVLGILGALCVVLVLLGATLHVSIILFSTGSMAPAIPTGSAALVREVPASQVEVGDVVTVDRPGRLPLTHRVVSVEDVAGDPAARSLTLRGDANAAADPAPYQVTHVRSVLAHAPGVAYALQWVARPPVLATGLLLLAALVVWALWPRRSESDGDRERPPHPAAEDPAPAHGGHPRTPARGAASVVVLAVAVVGCAIVHPGVARAEPTTRIVQGEVLRLTVISDPEAMASMAPGETARFVVGVSADAPDPGVIDVSVENPGARDPDFAVQVDVCTVAWTGSTCRGLARRLLDRVEPVPAALLAAQRISSEVETWVAVSVTMRETAAPGAALDVVVRARGFSDDVIVEPSPTPTSPPTATAAPTVTPLAPLPPGTPSPSASADVPGGPGEPPLAITGLPGVVPLAVLTLIVTSAGALLLAAAHRRRRQ